MATVTASEFSFIQLMIDLILLQTLQPFSVYPATSWKGTFLKSRGSQHLNTASKKSHKHFANVLKIKANKA